MASSGWGSGPSLPDSLPAIGRSKVSPHVVYAFGHGHLGLTQSAGTGRLVADLLTDRSPAIDLTLQPAQVLTWPYIRSPASTGTPAAILCGWSRVEVPDWRGPPCWNAGRISCGITTGYAPG
ncbi:MAG: FAD-dependent oxidoreductase [Tabrizicola sp.]